MAWRVWMLSGMVTGAVPEGTTGAAEHEPPVVDGCTVTVIGLPVPARAHHELEVAGARTRLSGDGLHLQLEHLEIAVRLVGPRYHGELSLHPRACTGGSTHVLKAHPKPARVRFEAPRSVAMRCEDGPDALRDRWWLLTDVPPFDVGHGATLRCEFKSPGYVPLHQRLPLLPGENTVALEMRRLGAPALLP